MGNLPGAAPLKDEKCTQALHVGEHSRAVLREWRISEQEIAVLQNRNALAHYSEPKVAQRTEAEV